MAGSSVAARRAMDAAQHAAAQAFAGFAEDLRGTDDVLRELANTDDLTTVTSLALALDASELSLPPILATVAPPAPRPRPPRFPPTLPSRPRLVPVPPPRPVGHPHLPREP